LAETGSALAAPRTTAAGKIKTARAERPLTAGLNSNCDRALGRDPALDLCIATGRIADGSIDDLHTITKTRWASTSARRDYDAPVAVKGVSRNSRRGDGHASRCQGRCLQTNTQPFRVFIRSAEHGDHHGYPLAA
jgi:hypothetical protein